MERRANRFVRALALLVALADPQALRASAPARSVDQVVTDFGNAVTVSRGFSYQKFEGGTRARFEPLLSKRLLAALDNVYACGLDWQAQEPPGSTDKPPFVDCCVFSASADWSPTSFVLGNSSLMADGRHRVIVEYRYDSPTEHGRWHVAVYVAEESGRFVVDDFEGGLDDPGSRRWFVLAKPSSCSSEGKWIVPVDPPDADEILAEIRRIGARRYLRNIEEDETLFDHVITGIQSGDAVWLDVALQLRAYSDGGFSESLDYAVARALPKAPARVLSLLGSGFDLEGVCTSPFNEPRTSVEESYERDALAALASVQDAGLRSRAIECAGRVQRPRHD